MTIVIMEFVQIEYRDCGLNPKYNIKIYVIDPKCNIRALHTLGTRTDIILAILDHFMV